MKFHPIKALAFGLVGSAALGGLTPAQAAVTGCAGQTMGTALWSDIVGTPGFTCQVEDKIYSNFSYSSTANEFGPGATSGIDPMDQFSFAAIGATGLVHNLNVQAVNSFINTKVLLSYTVTRASGVNVFDKYTANLTGDVDTTWALSLAATNAVASPSSTPSFPTLGQSATTPKLSFNPNVTSSTFSNTLYASNSGQGVTQFANRLEQKVPGPLPILGAGAAFGFSRKLRRRVSVAA